MIFETLLGIYMGTGFILFLFFGLGLMAYALTSKAKTDFDGCDALTITFGLMFACMFWLPIIILLTRKTKIGNQNILANTN